jgi:protein TonB
MCGGAARKEYQPVEEGPFEIAPILLKNVQPDYPRDAFEMGVTGTVWVKSLVDTLGNVIDAFVIRNAGENVTFFEESAIEAARKAKWKPAVSRGKPIAVWVTYRVDFDIK